MRTIEKETMKIGFVSMPIVGHLNPMTTLARRLQSRGHKVVFIGLPDVELAELKTPGYIG